MIATCTGSPTPTAADDPNGCAGKVAPGRRGNARRVAGDRGLSRRVTRRVHHEDLVAGDERDLEDQHQQPEDERQYERELDRRLSAVGDARRDRARSDHP